MRAVRLTAMCAASVMLAACSASHQDNHHMTTSATTSMMVSSVQDARYAAVRLLLTDLNALDNANATSPRFLRRLMAAYVPRALVSQHVADEIGSIRQARADGWRPPRLDAITVGKWQDTRIAGLDAMVRFVGYITNTTPQFGTDQLALEWFAVRMRWEDRRWKFVAYKQDWLTPAGPMAESGKNTIKALPVRVVFWNRRPRIGPKH